MVMCKGRDRCGRYELGKYFKFNSILNGTPGNSTIETVVISIYVRIFLAPDIICKLIEVIMEITPYIAMCDQMIRSRESLHELDVREGSV